MTTGPTGQQAAGSSPCGSTHDPSHARPTGFIQPGHERAVRAVAALEDDRVADAVKHIDAIPESTLIDRAGKLYLRGRVAIKRLDFETAEPLLLQAFALGVIDGMGGEAAPDPRAIRLGACALHHAAWIYRRQDRPEDAYRAHLAAHHLRELHGSFDEMWETAVELGLDAHVARRYGDAQRWHRAAIDAAGRVPEGPTRKQAIAWGYLSSSLTASCDYGSAVDASRRARDCWRKHDLGAADTAKADLSLGHALLKQGESLHEQDTRKARSALAEAIEWLTAAHEALLAFGPRCAADAQDCVDQKDFAGRLLHSLDA